MVLRSGQVSLRLLPVKWTVYWWLALNALIMQRYLYEYGWSHTDFALFSSNAHQNAEHNPYASLPAKISEDEYRQSRVIADPINLLDASPIGDGATVVTHILRKE